MHCDYDAHDAQKQTTLRNVGGQTSHVFWLPKHCPVGLGCCGFGCARLHCACGARHTHQSGCRSRKSLATMPPPPPQTNPLDTKTLLVRLAPWVKGNVLDPWRRRAHPYLPQEPQPSSDTFQTDPAPPNLSLAHPYTTRRTRKSDNAPAHMMHGSHVTYTSHLCNGGAAAIDTVLC